MSSLKNNIGGLGVSSASSGENSCSVNDDPSLRIEGGGNDSDEDYSHNSQNQDTSLQENYGTASNTSIIGKVKTRVSSILPNSISKWFSPSARPQNDSSSSFNGRLNLNISASTSRRRRHCEIDYDEEDNDEDNEDDKVVGTAEEGDGENYDDVIQQGSHTSEGGQEYDELEEDEVDDEYVSAPQRHRERLDCVEDTENAADTNAFDNNTNFSRLEMERTICNSTNLMRTSTRCVPPEKQTLGRPLNRTSENNHYRQEHQNQQQPPAKRLRLNTSSPIVRNNYGMYNAEPLGASTPALLGENFCKGGSNYSGQRSLTPYFSKYSTLRSHQRPIDRKESPHNHNVLANEAREQFYQHQQNDNLQSSSSRINRSKGNNNERTTTSLSQRATTNDINTSATIGEQAIQFNGHFSRLSSNSDTYGRLAGNNDRLSALRRKHETSIANGSQNIGGDAIINNRSSSEDPVLLDTASESGESGTKDYQQLSNLKNISSGISGSGNGPKRKCGLFNMSNSMNNTNSRYGQRTFSYGNGLNFYTHLEGKKSLFNVNNSSMSSNDSGPCSSGNLGILGEGCVGSKQSTLEKPLNTSTLSLTSLNRRQFNASIYGSTSALSDSRLLNATASPFYNGQTTYGGAAAYNRYRNISSANSVRIAPTRIRPNVYSPNLSSTSAGSSISAGIGGSTISGNHLNDNSTISNTAKRILELINEYNSPLCDAKKMMTGLRATNPPLLRGRLTDNDVNNARAARLLQVRTPYSRPTTGLLLQAKNLRHNAANEGNCSGQQQPPVKELQVPSMSQLIQMKKIHNVTEKARQITTENTRYMITVPSKEQSQQNNETNSNKSLKTSAADLSRMSTVTGKMETTTANVAESSKTASTTNLPYSMPITKGQQHYTGKVRSSKISSALRGGSSRLDLENEETLPELNLPNIVFPEVKFVPKFDIKLPISSQNSKTTAPATVTMSSSSSPFLPTIAKSTVTSTTTTTAMPLISGNQNPQLLSINTPLFGSNEQQSKAKIPAKTITTMGTSMISKNTFTFSAPLNMHNNVTMFGNEVRNAINTDKTTNYIFRPPKEIGGDDSLKSPFLSTNDSFKKFQKTSDQWECSTCMLFNKWDKKKCAACETARPTNNAISANTTSTNITAFSSFGQQFCKGKDEWECELCMIRNKSDAKNCIACGGTARKVDKPLTTLSVKNSFGDEFKMKPDTWECVTCLVINQSEKVQCVACQTPKKELNKLIESNSALTRDISHRLAMENASVTTSTTNTSNSRTLNDKDKSSIKINTDNTFIKLAKEQKLAKWECETCMTRNDIDRKRCVCCEQPKPGSGNNSGNDIANSPSVHSLNNSKSSGTFFNTPKFNFGATSETKFSFGFGANAASTTSVVDSGEKTIGSKATVESKISNTNLSTPSSSLSFGGFNSTKANNDDKSSTNDEKSTDGSGNKTDSNEKLKGTFLFGASSTTLSSSSSSSLATTLPSSATVSKLSNGTTTTTFSQNFQFSSPATLPSSSTKGFSLVRKTLPSSTNVISTQSFTNAGSESVTTITSSSVSFNLPLAVTAKTTTSTADIKSPTTISSNFTFGQNIGNKNGNITTSETTSSSTTLSSAQATKNFFGGFPFNSSKNNTNLGANEMNTATTNDITKTTTISMSPAQAPTASVGGFCFNPSSTITMDKSKTNSSTGIGTLSTTVATTKSIFGMSDVRPNCTAKTTETTFTTPTLINNSSCSSTSNDNTFKGFKFGGNAVFNTASGNLFGGNSPANNATTSVSSSSGTNATTTTTTTNIAITNVNNVVSSSDGGTTTTTAAVPIVSAISGTNSNNILSSFGSVTSSTSSSENFINVNNKNGTENTLKTSGSSLFGSHNNSSNNNQSATITSNDMAVNDNNTLPSSATTALSAISPAFIFGSTNNSFGASMKMTNTAAVTPLMSKSINNDGIASNASTATATASAAAGSIWNNNANKTFGNLPAFGSKSTTEVNSENIPKTNLFSFGAANAKNVSHSASTTSLSTPSLFGVAAASSSSTIPGATITPVISFGSNSGVSQTSLTNNNDNKNSSTLPTNLFANKSGNSLFGACSTSKTRADGDHPSFGGSTMQNSSSLFGAMPQSSASTFSFVSAADKTGVTQQANKPFTFRAPVSQNSSGGFNFGAAASSSSINLAPKPAFNFGAPTVLPAVGSTGGVTTPVPGASFNFSATGGDARNISSRPFQFGAAPSAPVFNFTAGSVETAPNTPFQFNASPGMISSNLFAPPPMAPGSQSSQAARRKVRVPVRRLAPR